MRRGGGKRVREGREQEREGRRKVKGSEFKNQLLSRLNLQPVEQHMNGVMREGMRGGRET